MVQGVATPNEVKLDKLSTIWPIFVTELRHYHRQGYNTDLLCLSVICDQQRD